MTTGGDYWVTGDQRMGECGLDHFWGVSVHSAAQFRKLDRNPCGTAAIPSSETEKWWMRRVTRGAGEAVTPAASSSLVMRSLPNGLAKYPTCGPRKLSPQVAPL